MLFSRSVLLAEASNYRFTLPTSLNFIVTVLPASPTRPSPTNRPHFASGDAAAFPEATNTPPAQPAHSGTHLQKGAQQAATPMSTLLVQATRDACTICTSHISWGRPWLLAGGLSCTPPSGPCSGCPSSDRLIPHVCLRGFQKRSRSFHTQQLSWTSFHTDGGKQL